MNRNTSITNQKINKHSILLYARKVRKIQAEQIEPYITAIEESLSELYPTLIGKENGGAQDWTCDILSESADVGVNEVLNRIEKLEHDRLIKQKQDESPMSDDVINSILDRLNRIESVLYDDNAHS